MKLTPSGSQTVGPFFRIGLDHLCSTGAIKGKNAETVTVFGKVLDGDGVAVPDAVLEIWHANAEGQYARESSVSGRSICFTRAATSDDGGFRFTIPKPGVVACDSGLKQARYVAVLVFARGLLRHLITRMYFQGDDGNSSDSLLQMVPDDRRATLIARNADGDARTFEWNVVLQGPEETVFFAW